MSPSKRVTVEIDGRTLTLSNLDKVLFPAVGFTKGQMIDYYRQVAEVMLPHVRDRPLTMRRFADGVDKPGFFEKHRPKGAPDWVRSVAVESTAQGDGSAGVEYPTVCDLPTMVWAANLASIEFHVPLWHVGRRRKLPTPPDYLVFDLDPGPGTTIVDCATVAHLVRAELEPQGYELYPKTSGSKGLQLYAAARARATWDDTRALAHDLAAKLQHDHPDQVVANMRKDRRTGRVLIDWSQNHAAKTTVAVYSIRARPEPTVSTPVTWDEVGACERDGDPGRLRFEPADVLARVAEQGDLFIAAR